MIDKYDVEKVNEILCKKITSRDKQNLIFYFTRAKMALEVYETQAQMEFVSLVRSFIRFYEFMIQASCFEDIELHKKYNFMTYLLSFINIRNATGGFDLGGKIKASNFIQKKIEKHVESKVVAQPITKLPTADNFGLTKEE